jgi:hypothetical protein
MKIKQNLNIIFLIIINSCFFTIVSSAKTLDLSLHEEDIQQNCLDKKRTLKTQDNITSLIAVRNAVTYSSTVTHSDQFDDSCDSNLMNDSNSRNLATSLEAQGNSKSHSASSLELFPNKNVFEELPKGPAEPTPAHVLNFQMSYGGRSK